jgi:hypothetical protein
MFSIQRIAAVAAIGAALCVPATATAGDWSTTAAQAKPTTDFVSPDARDSARPPVQVPAPPRTRIVEVPQAGFEWGDAAIGGAATLALVLLLAGVGMTVRPRRTATSSS